MKDRYVFRSAFVSHPGGRPQNEDYHGEMILPAAGCWMVADGLGGHGGGEVASQLAVEAVMQSFHKNPAVSGAAVRSYLEQAQDVILQKQHEDYKLIAMRTTAVVLVSDYREAVWAHLGDTRLYHFGCNQGLKQTKDHSVPQALVDAGEIKPQDIRGHEDRNRLLRVLGMPEDFRPAIMEKPVIVEAGDAFLLCSDGFWEYVDENDMAHCRKVAASPADWLAKMTEQIIARARPGHDNYTAIAIFVEQQGE